jgi:pimeloyl-ACP methyl ester carboxylesterase
MNFNEITSRTAADQQLEQYVKDLSVRQFLLKNMYWIEPGKRLAWRMNLLTLESEMQEILKGLPEEQVDLPTLFLYGALSNYILEEDMKAIEDLFLGASFEAIEGAGHWVHAEKPNEFVDAVLKFLLF